MRRRGGSYWIGLVLVALGIGYVARALRPAPRLSVDCAAAAQARVVAPDALHVENHGHVGIQEVARAWFTALEAETPAVRNELAPFHAVLRVPRPDGQEPAEIIALMPPGWTHVNDVSRFLAYRRSGQDDSTWTYRKIETEEFVAYLAAHPKASWRAWAESASCP